MNFLTDKIRPIYFKYLAAAFGSALITSIYGVVDAAMVGQYQGPTGTAALAVVAPVWNIIYTSHRHRRQRAAEHPAGSGPRQRKALQRIFHGGSPSNGGPVPSLLGGADSL